MTIGFALIFQDLALLIWGGDPYTVPMPADAARAPCAWAAPSFPIYRIFIVARGRAWWGWRSGSLLDRTRVGRDDPRRGGRRRDGPGAWASTCRASRWRVFALGAGLAALGGVIGGGFLGVYPGADFEVLPYAFVVVIVGGLGSLPGAMAGSLLVGLLDNFGKALFPELSYFTLFAPMALILAIRPTGLFGRAMIGPPRAPRRGGRRGALAAHRPLAARLPADRCSPRRSSSPSSP